MKIKKAVWNGTFCFRLILIPICISLFIAFLGPFARADEFIMAVPFDWKVEDEKPIATQVTFMLEEKLKLISHVKVIEHEKLVEWYSEKNDEKEFEWSSVETVDEFCEKKGIRYLVLGRIESVQVVDSKDTNHRWIGVNDYSLEIKIEGMIYDRVNKEIVMEKKTVAISKIPEVTLLGIHRSPIPSNARSIDAVIHDAVLSIVDSVKQFFDAKTQKNS